MRPLFNGHGRPFTKDTVLMDHDDKPVLSHGRPVAVHELTFGSFDMLLCPGGEPLLGLHHVPLRRNDLVIDRDGLPRLDENGQLVTKSKDIGMNHVSNQAQSLCEKDIVEPELWFDTDMVEVRSLY